MLWPVIVYAEPMVEPWTVGADVSPRLTWCDTPILPDDLILRDVPVRARPLRAPGTTTDWGQLVTAGDLVAARVGHIEAGDVRLDGCLQYDGYFQSSPQVPRTGARVHRIRTVSVLHDRGSDRWIPRPGMIRTADVPDTSGSHLVDDPQIWEPSPADEVPDLDSMVILSPEQYFALAGRLLPEQQWQAQGFLVDLEVPAAGRPAALT